ncbi:MAG: DnaJ domain-containing protein [Deltaproteobacteria bacterium]|nr:DnaJ domain-containing protein [Deltaproteobacteria bacterium]MBW2362633.1 DnaJ domain-containing protein [Deltaproteobacteria bacterium]
MKQAMESNDAQGRLDEVPLPRLLLTLLERRFDGALMLSRERVGKRFLFHKGAPVFAESNLASESLGVQLMDAGMLDRTGFNRATSHIERTGAKEGAALLELGLIQPKELFVALKAQVRVRLLECFGWTQGEFFVDDAAHAPADAQPFRLDVLSVVQDGIETYWSGERVIADLSAQMERFPRIRAGKEGILSRLQSDDAVQAYLEALDGTRSLWRAVQLARSPRALAAAWVLDAIGAIDYAEHATQDGDSANPQPPEVEIEIATPDASSTPLPGTPTSESRGSNETTSSGQGLQELRRDLVTDTAEGSVREAQDTDAAPAPPGPSAADETLCAQITAKHAELEAGTQGDHYATLELPETADAGQIRRAYLSAAKNYHPDALARLGLDANLREVANHVFARISKAHAVLSDPESRRQYDSIRTEDVTDLDAERVAQAETLYRKAEVLMRQGNFRAAAEFLEPAVETWPEECAYQSAFGWVLYKKTPPEAERAREHLERAARLDPDDGVNLFRLSVVLRDLGDHAAAEKAAARAEALTV